MTVLSHVTLERIYPDCRTIEPASIDLHIGDTLRSWPRYERRDPRRDQSSLWNPVGLREDDLGPYWVLVPGVRYLAATHERIRILPDHAGQIGARSSWARDGLSVIQGPAGWCDPGYIGNPTLELSVIGSELVIWPGARVAQLILFELSEAATRGYGHSSRQSKYQGHIGPEPSQTWREVAPVEARAAIGGPS